MAHTKQIDIFEYNISADDMADIYYSFATRHPECLVHTELIYYSQKDTNIVVYFEPTYIFSNTEDDNAARTLMQKKVDEYVKLAEQFDSPLEKLLMIHDEMIKNYEYDPIIENTDETTGKTSQKPSKGTISYHAYGIFSNNTAVCQGYAQAFYMILNKLGIEADFCKSESINHIWNYVKLDGKWYHVDVTWDEADNTKAAHRNFMISDNTRKSIIMSSSYRNQAKLDDWNTYLDILPDCSSTNYESEYLFNIVIPFTVSYKDGYFTAPCTFTNGQLTFRSKNLRAGIIAVTEPVKSASGVYSYGYYILSDYNEPVTPISVNVKNGQYTSFYYNNPISYAYSASLDYIYSDSAADYTDVFFWNTDTLMPASGKIRID